MIMNLKYIILYISSKNSLFFTVINFTRNVCEIAVKLKLPWGLLGQFSKEVSPIPAHTYNFDKQQ